MLYALSRWWRNWRWIMWDAIKEWLWGVVWVFFALLGAAVALTAIAALLNLVLSCTKGVWA